MKRVRERRRERAANSRATEAEGCCRTRARATEPAATLRVMRNTQSSLNILEQLTMKKLLRDRVTIPSVTNERGHREADASLGAGGIQPQAEGRSTGRRSLPEQQGRGCRRLLCSLALPRPHGTSSQLASRSSFGIALRSSPATDSSKVTGTVKIIRTCIYC